MTMNLRKGFIVYKVLPYPLPPAALITPPWESPMAGVTSQINLSKVNMSTLGPGGPTSQSRCYWSNAAHTPLLGHTHFQETSQLRSTHGIWEVSVFCSAPQEPPWAFCFLRGRPGHWTPQNPLSWALRAREGGG